ncbi:MBL fold metallo-hydrolase [Gemmobacter nectariphilus]|uniref:MBL fold metallo-hydrolase n=1 Tax=Gemmobacter nectariphilus TaxID=220343 RepID=UPI00041EF9A7|nr:MBL fold metallo-hydrolase [Gemmobacter nectariphilus]
MTTPLDLQRIIEIDRFALPASFLFPDCDLEALRPHAAVLDPHHVDFAAGTILLGVQSMVLCHGGLNILIDTCVGGCKERPARPEWHQIAPRIYLDQLAAAGLRAEDIDIVLCTHLHADHVGWNTRLENGRWVPTFPNARYLISGIELDHWLTQEGIAPGKHNHGAFADSVQPVLEAGLVERVEDGADLGHGMTLLGLPGHSPGQVGLELQRQGAPDICFCGDGFHSLAQAYQPDWHSRFCADGARSSLTRRGLLDRSARDGLVIVPSHIRRDIGFTFDGAGPRLLQTL